MRRIIEIMNALDRIRLPWWPLIFMGGVLLAPGIWKFIETQGHADWHLIGQGILGIACGIFLWPAGPRSISALMWRHNGERRWPGVLIAVGLVVLIVLNFVTRPPEIFGGFFYYYREPSSIAVLNRCRSMTD